MENQQIIISKCCYKCNQVFPLTSEYFFRNRAKKDGFRPECKICNRKYFKEKLYAKWLVKSRKTNRIYYSKHKEKFHLKSKKRWTKNKNILSLKYKLWQKQHPNYFKNYYQKNKNKFTQYTLEKCQSDTSFKLAKRLRTRIWGALKGLHKSESTTRLLGCSIGELKTYLSSKFQPGMSWNNYGKWHIDHIRPCSSFDLSKSEEQSKCFNYTNLQPLWAKDNISKGSKHVEK